MRASTEKERLQMLFDRWGMPGAESHYPIRLRCGDIVLVSSNYIAFFGEQLTCPRCKKLTTVVKV